MMQDGRVEAAQHGSSLARLVALGSPLVFAAYAVVLQISRDRSLSDALLGGVANTIPTIFFAIPAYWLASRLLNRKAAVQAAGHALIGATYALLSYWLLVVLLGALQGASLVRFTVEPFPTRSSAWQLLLNLAVYGIVAALANARMIAPAMPFLTAKPGAERPEPTLSRYFIRSGDELRPVDVGQIISIAGADDYAEVATLDSRHLVRMTLAEFERALDPARFMRVHRSRIVNVERIERAEPAGGGRLLLYLENGETIVASRAGSKLLRDRTI